MTDDAPESEIPARAHVVAGQWYPDGWASVYIRADIPVGPGKWKLKLELFVPNGGQKPPDILVRLGTKALSSITGIVPGRLCRHEISLPETAATTVLPISVRASHARSTTGGDARSLGAVLKTWSVAGIPDEAKPAEGRPPTGRKAD